MLNFLRRLFNLNMRDRPNNQTSSLSDYHFKFIVTFNLAIFLFYTLFRIYMAAKLVLVEHQNFFVGIFRVHEEGLPYYTLYRVFFPVFIAFGFLWLYNKLYKKKEIKKVFRNFWLLIVPSWRGIKKYILFLLISFIVLSFIPGFTLLLRNPNTIYGMIDTNSYMSIIALMNRGDFNAVYVPEGGYQFGKYYINSIPALFFTWILGLKNLAASYNISLFLLVFLIILNFIFTFRNLFYEKDESFKDEVMKIIFISILIVLSISFVVFKDFFNFNAILQVYNSGFIGATGGIFLLSSILFLFSYFLRERKPGSINLHIIFLTLFLFSIMLVQDYFHFALFFLPMGGLLLVLLLSKKEFLLTTVKRLVLFIGFLAVIYASYKALDIHPKYNMEPLTKLKILSIDLTVTFFVFWLINFFTKDFLYKLFVRFSNWIILICFSAPFIWYVWQILTPQSMNKVEFFGITLRLGDSRTFIFGLLLQTLILAFILFSLIKIIFKEKTKIIYPLIVTLLLFSLFLVRIYIPRERFVLSYDSYPPYYDEDMKIMNTNNLYAFDKNDIRLTYNSYLVDVTKYFLENNILDIYFFLITQTPSQGIHEIGYLERALATASHQMQGITITDLEEFSNNIDNFEEDTRFLENRFLRRYLIIDNNLPERSTNYLNSSSLYQKKI